MSEPTMTFAIIKPDAVRAGNTGNIIQRITDNGFTVKICSERGFHGRCHDVEASFEDCTNVPHDMNGIASINTYDKCVDFQIIGVDSILLCSFAVLPEMGFQLRIGHRIWLHVGYVICRRVLDWSAVR